MKITSIALEKYVPLLHGGIDKLEIEVTQPVVCCIGQNGSGKTSVLRELSVYPPTSTDFKRGGGKTLTVQHNGLKYELSSVFDGNKGTHSFKVEGEELNDSKNSTTQTSLCESHFGISSLIKGITSGEVNMSTLSRIDRKNLLAACYPSDLTFILKYHQKVKSNIRALKANIKMMLNRQLELTDAMMDEQEFARLRTLVDQLNEFRLEVDKWIHSFERELNEWKQHPAYADRLHENNDLNEDDICQEIREILSKHSTLMMTYPLLPEGALSDNIATTSLSIDMKRGSMNDLLNESKVLTDEINEYEELADRNLDEELEGLRREIKSLNEHIANLPIDPKIPKISPREAELFNLEKLQRAILHIHSTGCTVLSSKELNEKLTDINDSTREIGIINTNLHRLRDALDKLQTKHARAVNSAFNPKCALPCQLKDNYNQSVGELVNEIDQLVKSIADLEDQRDKYTKKVDDLRKSIQGPSECSAQVAWLENMADRAPGMEYVLNGNNIIDILNTSPMEIHNRVERMVANASALHEKQSLDESLSSATYKQKVLLESKVPAKELISKSLVEKQARLKELGDKYATSKQLIQEMESILAAYQELNSLRNTTSVMKDDYITKANFHRIRMKIEQLTEIIGSLNKYRMLADEKQNEIKGVVRAQEHHRIRLNEEVLPSLEKLTSNLKQLEAVESALSPNTGLPHVYMVRFINGCINTVNDYIRAVWNKDMVIKNLNESDALDFTFQVEHNRTSVVKDISTCSRGEQEMINLAWTLALCSHMQLGLQYPIRTDECDSGMTPGHRQKLLTLLSTLVRQGDIKQLFIVNHFSSLFTSFANSQIVCLSEDGIALPANYNECVTIN